MGSKDDVKKELVTRVRKDLEEKIRSWVESKDKSKTLVIRLEKSREMECEDIIYIASSFNEIIEKGLLEEYKNGRVIIAACC